MSRKRNQGAQSGKILQLFKQVESALEEIEQSLGESSADLEKQMMQLSTRVRGKKRALLEGLLRVAKDLGIAGPWRLPGKRLGWCRLDHESVSTTWIHYTEKREPWTTFRVLLVSNVLGEDSYLFTPLCEMLIGEIDRAIADFAPVAKRAGQVKRRLKCASAKARKTKPKTGQTV